jgi:D-tyrosyl-tRNA(Tyr) deacylase
MRAVVQRVSGAQVVVSEKIVGKIGRGLLVLLGVAQADGETDADFLADKIAGLRIFEDGSGKMNVDVTSICGQVLVVSQFTLYGDVRRGKRPSFDAAAPPQTRPCAVRILCGTHPRQRHSVRNRTLPGNDAGGVSK